MTNRESSSGGVLPVRGYLLHITHYDPRWWAEKDGEQPFDQALGLDLVDAMAEAGMNLLAVDIADGVRYASHPELARPYSVAMTALSELVARAGGHGIEVVPKLNFSQSGLHHHNDWFRPHNMLFDTDEYWELAFEVVDELIEVVHPARFFHVGMDEDHWRSYGQYVAAINTLHAGLATRGLRTVIWNDSAGLYPQAAIHRDKSLLAEAIVSKDIVHVVWDYGGAPEETLRRISKAGFEVWGAPGRDAALVAEMREAVKRAGGSGLLLTRWMPCVERNRQDLVESILALGPVCSG